MKGTHAGSRMQDADPRARAGQPFLAFPVFSPGTLSGRMFVMGDKDRRRCSGNEPMKRRSSLEAGFDRWLNRQLHEIYDPVLNEAIPDEMAKLLDQFEGDPEKTEGGSDGSK